jgi:hypothetical protein
MNATPAGGTYSGTGVVGGAFDPAVAGPGVYTITYTYTNANGCTNSDDATYTVNNCTVSTLPPMDAPGYLIVTGIDVNKLELRFPDAMSDEDGYEVYRSTDGVSFALHTTTGAYSSSPIYWYDSVNVDPDKAYYYIVRTKKGTRRSGFSNSAYDYTYPLPPVLVSMNDACISGSGRIEVTAPHLTGYFLWFAENPSSTPYMDTDGNYYLKSYFNTPNIPVATTYYVASKGFRYLSKTRLAVTVGIKSRPTAKLLTTSREIYACSSSQLLQAEVVAGAQYVWYKNGYQVASAGTAEYTATETGSYTVKVLANGCDAYSDWVYVKLNYKPIAKVKQGATVNYCESGKLTAAEVFGAEEYKWFKDGDYFGSGAEILVNASGNYDLVVVKYGCESNAYQVRVTVNTFPTALSLTASNETFCPGETSVLTAESLPGVSYEWLREDKVFRYTSANSITVTQGGTYAVRLVYNTNCSKVSDKITLTRLVVPSVRVIFDGEMKLLTADASEIASVQWFINGDAQADLAGKQSFVPTKSGKYSALVTFKNGCSKQTGSVFAILGIEDEDEQNPVFDLLIYPNPTRDILNISTDGKGLLSVRITDVLGRVLTETNDLRIENNLVKIDVSALPNGIYTLNVVKDGQSRTVKFVKD